MPLPTDELRLIDPVLTSLAQGYSNSKLIYPVIFPEVSVPKLKGKVPVFGKESFVIKNTLRALRSASNRTPPSDLTTKPYECLERDIETALDYLESLEALAGLLYEQKITLDLVDAVDLQKEKEAADFLQNADNFTGLTTNSAGWNTAMDPMVNILTGKNAVRDLIGQFPNTCIMGQVAFNALLTNSAMTDRIAYSNPAILTKDLIRQIFGFDVLEVGGAVFSADGLSFADVWEDNCILAFVDQNAKEKRSQYNPSYGYTFEREGTKIIDTYFEVGGKVKVIRYTDNYCQKNVCSDAGFLITNCVS